MTDQYLTSKKTLEITHIGHSSLMFRFGNEIIYVDPYSDVADFSQMPKADLILITHHHGDHLDEMAIDDIAQPSTTILGSAIAIKELGRGTAMNNGDQTTWNDILIKAVPAYNILSMRSPGEPYHIKGQGNGYLIGMDTLHVYIAGDTELIPEMKDLGKIDIAFLPKDTPYTMSDEMFVEAAKLLKPSVLYPYHYLEVDRAALQKALPDIKIR